MTTHATSTASALADCQTETERQNVLAFVRIAKKARATYEQLERLALPHLETFRADLTEHDRRWIENNPDTPFVHMTRDTGTILTGLYPADSNAFPADGDRIPYLFGHADRWHMLRDGTSLICRAEGEHIYHYCNGRTVRPITHAEAQTIRRDYIRTVSAAWGR